MSDERADSTDAWLQEFNDMAFLDPLSEGGGERCPECGSTWTMPTLLAPGEWQCWIRSCSAIWTVTK